MKNIKKMMCLLLALTLCMVAPMTVYAATCPPHYTKLYTNYTGTSYSESGTHTIIFEYRENPYTGELIPIRQTCSYDNYYQRDINMYKCTICGLVTSQYTSSRLVSSSHSLCK